MSTLSPGWGMPALSMLPAIFLLSPGGKQGPVVSHFPQQKHNPLQPHRARSAGMLVTQMCSPAPHSLPTNSHQQGTVALSPCSSRLYQTAAPCPFAMVT